MNKSRGFTIFVDKGFVEQHVFESMQNTCLCKSAHHKT